MIRVKDYVSPRERIFCNVTETNVQNKSTYGRNIEPGEIFRVFSIEWIEHKGDYQMVLFSPHFEKSLIFIEGYGRDFIKITDAKTLALLKILYG